VLDAEDGQQGLEIMMDAYFDLVLCDIDMPEMDGLQCVGHLREWEEEHRPERRQLVCCMTGEDGISDEDIKAAGMDLVLRKPYNKSKVRALVDRLQSETQLT
jgi:CheY-like chemotaxis protein